MGVVRVITVESLTTILGALYYKLRFRQLLLKQSTTISNALDVSPRCFL